MRVAAPRDESAVTDVLGSILLVSITLGVGVSLSLMVASFDAPTDDRPAILSVELLPGVAGWGTGDESIVIDHRGGKDLPSGTLDAIVGIAQVPTTTQPGSDAPFDDDVLSPGETWTLPRLVPGDTDVEVLVVYDDGRAFVLAAANFRTDDGLDCSGDTAGPTVTTWQQTPSDVDTSTSGTVTVQATLDDDCAGVQTAAPPTLQHRVNDGSDPAWSDVASTYVSGTTFEATVPAPSGGWSAHGGSDLEYRLTNMQDALGNSADSTVQTDGIQTATTYTYADCPPTMTLGSVSSCADLQDDTDSSSARFQEGSVPDTVTADHYGTSARTNGDTYDENNGIGAPDDAHAVIPSRNDRLRVEDFPSGTGTILEIHLVYEGHYQGTLDDDFVRLGYRLGNSLQDDRLDFDPHPTDTEVTFDVTSFRSWTWADVLDMEVDAQFKKTGSEDAIDIHVDALWVRITTDTTTYRLDGTVTFTSVPAGTQTLQMEYQAFTDDFQVEVWDGSAWNVRGDTLVPGPETAWSYALTTAEYNSGSPRVRLTDLNTAPTVTSDLFIDYLRIRTT